MNIKMKGERLKVKGEKVKGVFLLFFLSIFNFQFSVATAQELLNYPLDTVNGEEVYKYDVEKSIGLYRIGVNFNVSQSEIIRLNPQLNEHGVRYGDTLLIPTGRKVETKAKGAKLKVKEDVQIHETPAKVVKTEIKEMQVKEMPVREQIVREDLPVVPVVQAAPAIQAAPTTPEYDGKVVELALMLPFESKQTKRSTNADRLLEFYQGALLALHDLQNDSVRYRLRVYDTERSERRVNALCDSTELDHVQAILGLVYPIQIERMAAWCEAHQVPLLLPFSDNIQMANRPHVLQFNSTDEQEADSLCTWITNHDTHCVAIDVRDADLAGSVRVLRQRMQKNGLSCATLPLRDLLNDSAAYALDTAKENLIILHSDKFQHVRILLPHLHKLQEEGYPIRIVSQYSWQKEDIRLPQVYLSMFDDPLQREQYDALWNTYFDATHVSEVPRYDLLGYDLMQALVAWLYGTKEKQGLQSDIRWIQTGENGGWQNGEIKVVEK